MESYPKLKKSILKKIAPCQINHKSFFLVLNYVAVYFVNSVKYELWTSFGCGQIWKKIVLYQVVFNLFVQKTQLKHQFLQRRLFPKKYFQNNQSPRMTNLASRISHKGFCTILCKFSFLFTFTIHSSVHNW